MESLHQEVCGENMFVKNVGGDLVRNAENVWKCLSFSKVLEM